MERLVACHGIFGGRLLTHLVTHSRWCSRLGVIHSERRI